MNHLDDLGIKCLSSISADDVIAIKEFRESYNASRPTDYNIKNDSIQSTSWCPPEDLPPCGWRPLDDITLYRFLCADRRNGKFQQDASLDRLLKTLVYRKEQKADEILRAITTEGSIPSEQPELSRLLPHLEKYKRLRIRVFTGRDHYDQPVMFERLGEFISSGNYNQFTIEEWVQYYVWDLERHFVEMRHAAQDTGKPVFKFVIFLDARGINRNALKVTTLLKALTKAVETFYPEIAARIIIFRIPKIMSLLYRAVRVFLDPVTAEKIYLYPGIPTEEFLKHVPLNAIPEEYGGKSQVQFPETATS